MFRSLISIIFVFLVACDSNGSTGGVSGADAEKKARFNNMISQSDNSNASSVYRMMEVDKQVEDSDSEFGYWEILLTYPEIVGDYPDNIKENVNSEIRNLVEMFSCSGKGDQTFTANVTHSSNEFLSFKYEAFWMCPKMPSTQSVQGGYTVDLTSGRRVVLEEEFKGDFEKADMEKIVVKNLKNKVEYKEQDGGMDCPLVDEISYFYVTDDSVILGWAARHHMNAPCNSEVRMYAAELKRYFKANSPLNRITQQ